MFKNQGGNLHKDGCMETIDQAIAALDINTDQDKIDLWIRDYQPFIISTVSKVLNRYVEIENDEAYSVALLAFVEAIGRYAIEKGPFLPFCRLVIASRVKNHLKREEKFNHLSLDAMDPSLNSPYLQTPPEEDTPLSDEVQQLDALLSDYGISFSALVNNSPKHGDTKAQLLEIAYKIQSIPEFLQFLHTKKRLPLTQIALRCNVSIKTLKSFKSYLIALLMILENNLIGIKNWIKIEKGPEK